MRAWLQRHVHGGALRRLFGLAQRLDFGVRTAAGLRPAAAEDDAVLDDHRADRRIGPDIAEPAPAERERKRPVDPERVEQMVSKIVRELESMGENEVSSEAIGEAVMAHLREMDDVAYVRFASVYRNFREPKDFRAALDELSGDEAGKPAATARK